MDDIDKIKTFIEATKLHTQDGIDFGMNAGEVAKLMIAFGVGLHMQEYGLPATVKTLRAQADKLESKDD